MEKKVDRQNIIYRKKLYTYGFQKFWTISTFVRCIYNGTTILKETDQSQSDLLVEILGYK